MAALAAWATEPAQIQLRATAKQLQLTECKAAQLRAAGHSSIRAGPCSLRYHTAHGTAGTMPLANAQL